MTNTTKDEHTPPMTREALRKVIIPQLSRAYYNGLDRKGWSQFEENEAIDAIMTAVDAYRKAEEPKVEIKAKIEVLDKLVMGAGEFHDDPYEYVVPLRHIHAYRADLEKFDLSQLVLKERKRGK